MQRAWALFVAVASFIRLFGAFSVRYQLHSVLQSAGCVLIICNLDNCVAWLRLCTFCFGGLNFAHRSLIRLRGGRGRCFLDVGCVQVAIGGMPESRGLLVDRS